MASAANQKSMELEGNLSSFQLADVLKFLAMGRMTGMLGLASGQRSVGLLIGEGKIRGVTGADQDRVLGQLLARAGAMDRRRLQEAMDLLRDQRGGARRLASLLLERRWIDREALRRALALQVKEELWEVFGWTDGKFRFEHGPLPDNIGEEELIDLPIEPLIAEANEQLERWRAIESALGRQDAIYGVSPKIKAIPDAPLPPAAWRVLSLIDGRHTVGGLLDLSGLGKFETLEALDHLLNRGMIEQLARPRDGTPKPTPKPPVATPSASAPPPSSAPPAATVLAEETGGGLLGRFRLRRRAAAPSSGGDKEPAGLSPSSPSAMSASTSSSPVKCLTGAGCACALLNRLAAWLAEEAVARNVALPATLADLWRAEADRRPRADLARVSADGGLEVERLEGYARLAGGVDRYLAGTHEETMDALALTGGALARMAVEALGADARARMAEAAEPLLKTCEARWPADFSARAWARHWMEL
jgi:hypothetical protein